MTVSTESSSDANQDCTHGCFLDKIIGIDVLLNRVSALGEANNDGDDLLLRETWLRISVLWWKS